MRFFFRLALQGFLILVFMPANADERPNIMLILADDVGFSDIGVYGGEIRTPNIDALANEGILLTNFYAAPTCGPSRSMMLTGVDHHRIGAGINKAGLMRLPQLKSRPGYEGFLNDKVVTVATLLKDSGYHTFMTGKWDPSGGPGNLAANRGFEKSWILAAGGASHFSDAVGTFRQTAEVHYYENEDRVETLPDDFYSSEFYASKMIEYVDDIDDDNPYLAYVAFTAAHWPLQVPDDWIDKYKGDFDDGWQDVRESRFARQLESGIIPRHTQLPPQNRAAANWSSLSPEQRKVEARRMEIYAAMIENLDFQVGRLLQNLKSNDSDRETIVIFLSDNGSEGNAVQRIIGNDVWIPERFDNSLDNMGRINSYVWLGVGWAQAAATPFRLYKTYTTGGGMRTPAIFFSSKGRFAAAKMDGVVLTRDMTPTILELAGVAAAVDTYKGKPVLPVSGKSALSYLQGKTASVHDEEPLGWELYGSRALLKGEWKAVRIFPPEGSGEWALYNVKTDPTETIDLAEDYADVLDELIADWNIYAEQNGVAVFEEDLGYGRYADQTSTSP